MESSPTFYISLTTIYYLYPFIWIFRYHIMNKTWQDVFSVYMSPPPPPPKKKQKQKQKQHVLIDRLLQSALFQQENEILNISGTDSIHALFSIAKIYNLSRFRKNNVWQVDIHLSKLYMFYKVASETICEKWHRGRKKREKELREREREREKERIAFLVYALSSINDLRSLPIAITVTLNHQGR